MPGFIHPAFVVAAIEQEAEVARQRYRRYKAFGRLPNQRKRIDRSSLSPEELIAHVRMISRDSARRKRERNKKPKRAPMTKAEVYAKVRAWKEKNKERLKGWYRNYRSVNKDKVSLWSTRSRQRYPERIKARSKAYAQHKRKSDPAWRLRMNLATAIRNRLRGTAGYKDIEAVLGCSMSDFKRHIEMEFQDGMSWENKGQWHLDHVCPASCAGGDMELMRQLFNYMNLRPEWKETNIRKSNKISSDSIFTAWNLGIQEMHLRSKTQIDEYDLAYAKASGIKVLLKGVQIA